MAKKSSRHVPVGTRICVKPGLTAPEMADVVIGGWTGCIMEVAGKKSDQPKYMVEWDGITVQKMPKSYLEQCEQRGLYYAMACLEADQFDTLDD